MKSLTATFLCVVLLGSAIAAWADTSCGIPSYPVLNAGSGLCEAWPGNKGYGCQSYNYTAGGCDDIPPVNNACTTATVGEPTYDVSGTCNAGNVGSTCTTGNVMYVNVETATTAGIQCVPGG
jgi:hypothetical protein